MSGGVKLHRHRPERDRDCSKNLVPPSALLARSVFPAVWAGQRNLRSSRTRDFKSSASTVVSVGMEQITRRNETRNAFSAARTLYVCPLARRQIRSGKRFRLLSSDRA